MAPRHHWLLTCALLWLEAHSKSIALRENWRIIPLRVIQNSRSVASLSLTIATFFTVTSPRLPDMRFVGSVRSLFTAARYREKWLAANSLLPGHAQFQPG